MIRLTDVEKSSIIGRKVRDELEERETSLHKRLAQRQSDDPLTDAQLTAELRGRLWEIGRMKEFFSLGPEVAPGDLFEDDDALA